MKVTKALFPIAGLGTRFLPATKASAKEMLPGVDKPLIQYAVEEAYAAGVRHMIFVTGRVGADAGDQVKVFQINAAGGRGGGRVSGLAGTAARDGGVKGKLTTSHTPSAESPIMKYA